MRVWSMDEGVECGGGGGDWVVAMGLMGRIGAW